MAGRTNRTLSERRERVKVAVPKDGREAVILAAYANGVPMAKIARDMGLTWSAEINQIIHRAVIRGMKQRETA